jgi:hypothetical protein
MNPALRSSTRLGSRWVPLDVNGTNGNDAIGIVGNAFSTSVLGLAAQANLIDAEPGLDRLSVSALNGDDSIERDGAEARLASASRVGFGASQHVERVGAVVNSVIGAQSVVISRYF